MKITILPPSGSGTPAILGNDPVGDWILNFTPTHLRNFQDKKLFRADYAGRIDRNNRGNAITWRVDRQHPDYDTSFAFYLAHADTVPSIGVVEVTNGSRTLWLTNATIDAPKCLSYIGVSTVFEYTAVGGAWSTKNPNT